MKRNIKIKELTKELEAWLNHIGYRKYCSEIKENEYKELATWILNEVD